MFRTSAIVTILAALLCSGACGGAASGDSSPPRVASGELDLRGRDPGPRDRISLEGEWEFYWRRFLEPQSAARAPASPDGFFPIPALWNGRRVGDASLSAEGFASYRLVIRRDSSRALLAVRIPDLESAYRLYANGALIGSNGAPASEASLEQPEWRPAVFPFVARGDVELLLHVSNFSHRWGGFWQGMETGRAETLLADQAHDIAYTQFLAGAILIFGLYHLLIFFVRRRETPYLWLGLFCLMMGLRSLCTGERYIVDLFPGFPWDWLVRIDYWTVCLPLALVHAYLREIFPEEYDRNMFRGLLAISLASALVILCLPPRWFTYVGVPYTATLFVWSVYALLVLMRAVLRRRPGAWVNAGGWFVFTAAVYWDTLYYIGYLRAGGHIALGFQVFAFAQSWYLAQRYARSIELNDKLGRRIRSLLELTRDLNRSNEAARTLRVAGQALQSALATSGLRLYLKDTTAPSGWREISEEPKSEGLRTTLSAQDAEALNQRSSALSVEGARVFATALRNGESLGVIELSDPPPGAVDREADYLRGVLESTALALENIRRARMETLATVGQLAAEIVADINRHCELILQQASRARGATREEALLRIEREIEFMRQMALDILDYARDRIVVRRSVCDPEKLAAAMREDLQRQFADSGIQVSVSASGRESLFLDVDRFRRVALNLAKNSAESMPGGGHFRVEIAREADGLYFSFEDDGPGMPPEKLSSLYEPAVRLDSRGRGLGLAVARRIVHAHDGVITARSGAGAGSRFVVILPAAVSEAGAPAFD